MKAIVKGDPPQLPDEGYSDEAKNFVRSCLNKNASLRPSYSKLIRHPWLVSLMKPPTSGEEGSPLPTTDGSKAATGPQETGVEPPTADYPHTPPVEIFDREVSDWVCGKLDQKLNGRSQKARPALHAVKLDAVSGNTLLDGPP